LQKKKFRSFEKARDFSHSLKLKSYKHWARYCKSGKRPIDIPSAPDQNYKTEWKGWGDWLGTGRVAAQLKQFRSFEEAREFSHSLKLKSYKHWARYCKSGKKPIDVPSAPDKSYKTEWKGWGDWLGTGTVATYQRQFLSFKDAREFVHKLKLKGRSEWELYRKSEKKPSNIPTNPNTIYKKEWKSFGDFLGTGSIAPKDKEFLEFEEAREFIQSLHLQSVKDWREFLKSEKNPGNLPSNPEGIYKNKGWISWGDFLGTGNIAPFNIEYKSFAEAKTLYRKLAKEYGLKNFSDWRRFTKTHKLPDGISASPWRTFSKERILKRKKN